MHLTPNIKFNTDELMKFNFEILEFIDKIKIQGNEKGIIKFVDVRYATDTDVNSDFEEFYTLQPGMTANNTPTTKQELSVDYSLIEFDCVHLNYILNHQ